MFSLRSSNFEISFDEAQDQVVFSVKATATEWGSASTGRNIWQRRKRPRGNFKALLQRHYVCLCFAKKIENFNTSGINPCKKGMIKTEVFSFI